MKPDRWNKVEKLYRAALERPAESRAEFLRSACGDDEELYREVESLLSFKSQAESFIEKPALEVAAEATAAGCVTCLIGKEIHNSKNFSPLRQGAMRGAYIAAYSQPK